MSCQEKIMMEKDKRSKTSKSRRETAVQGTNDSSIVSKCSMSLQGYFDDPYLKCFVSKVTRRAPLIHRGYYIRAKTIDFILKKFLESNRGDKQIISLGAGFDSAYFRLKSQNILQDTIFFEVDFPEVVKRKHALIDLNPELLALIGESSSLISEKCQHIEMSTSDYRLLGADLSQINTLEAALKLCHIDFDVPTLLLSECVLTYMTRRTASGVVRWANETFSNSVFVLYEQINPTDAFGLFMQHHFQTVGSPLKCINFFPTIQTQKDRFTQMGWRNLEVLDMNEFYNMMLDDTEQERVEKLEMFDEYEEWHLKCAHYMVLLGYNGDCEQLLTGMKKLLVADKSLNVVKEYDGFVKFSSLASTQVIRRFGHATARLGTSHAVCIGGFGEQEGKHMRVTDIVLVEPVAMEITVVNPDVDNRLLEVSRMHASLSTLHDGRLLLIGGRLSPMRLCSQIVAIELNYGKEKMKISEFVKCMNCEKNKDRNRSNGEDKNFIEESNIKESINENCVVDLCTNCSTFNISDKNKIHTNFKSEGTEKCERKENFTKSDVKIVEAETEPVIKEDCKNNITVKITVIEQIGDLPCQRWRHTAVVYNKKGKEFIIVYGGRSQHVLALEDCYKFIIDSNTWTKMETTGLLPEAHLSHSASIWKDNMVIAGGLNKSLQPLSSVYLLNLETNEWSQVDCKIKPRYSHTAHVIDDILILIGGVSFSHDAPGVALIHLPSGISAEFSLPAADMENLVMLHRHTSFIMDNNRIMLLGGGGNCFSFGTHLNSSPLIFDFSECLRTIKQTILDHTEESEKKDKI